MFRHAHAFGAYRGFWFDAEGFDLFGGAVDVALDLQGFALGFEPKF